MSCEAMGLCGIFIGGNVSPPPGGGEKKKAGKLTSHDPTAQPAHAKDSSPVASFDPNHGPGIVALALLHLRACVHADSFLAAFDLARVELGVIEPVPLAFDFERGRVDADAELAVHVGREDEAGGEGGAEGRRVIGAEVAASG